MITLPKCINNNDISSVCMQKQCYKNPFLCDIKNCICQQYHRICLPIKWKVLQQSIQKTRSVLVYQTRDRFNLISQSFSKILKEIQVVYFQFKEFESSYGFNDITLNFIKSLQHHNFDMITGDQINKVYQVISFQEQTDLNRFEIIKQQIVEIQPIVNLLKSRLKNLYQKRKTESLYSFSYKFKSSTIQIQNNIAKQTEKSQQGINSIGLLQPELMNQKNHWAIKLLNGEMALGICIKQVIVKNKYGFLDYKKKGHGTYMIDSYGYSFSHSQQSINNRICSFKFTKNDIIILCFDKSMNVLRFRQKNTHKQFEMQIPPTQSPLYPCIMLWDKGQMAQIYKI